MLLLVALFSLTGARAQQTLPYYEDFDGEEIGDWSVANIADGTGLASDKGEGYCFDFHWSTNPPQYLISPEFDGTSAMTVSFDYAIESDYFPETFQVGYSTTTSDVSAFTWGEQVTATNVYNSEWLQYEVNFPAGTKYVAIRYNSNDMYYLYLDNFSFVAYSGIMNPAGLAASQVLATSANINWNGGADSFNLRYGLPSGESQDFEDSSLGGWTTIDADGDGYGWVLGSNVGGVYLAQGSSLAGNGYNDSQDLIVSGSYSNVDGVGALTPDNYLVSPKVKLGGSISFWAKGQDASYASEVFGVAVSTTDNTNASSFTMVGANKTATGEWTQYTFDLSAYSGEGYVAIRHYNVSDMFLLDIDDIVIVESIDWTTISGITTNSYELTGLTPETSYQVQVQGVYASGVSGWESTSFTTQGSNPTPTNVVATPGAFTADISWSGESDSYEVKYKKVYFADDFSNGLDNWTVYTEGEGPGWIMSEEYNCPVAYSYDNDTRTAWNADNWLITPCINLGGLLEFYVMTASSYPDSYEVLLSTSGNAISDFNVTLQEMATAQSGYVDIDLSEYEGQEGYIAIHHVSYNAYILAIADFGIYSLDTTNWDTVTTNDTSVQLTGLEPNSTYEFIITGQQDGASDASTGIFLFTTLEQPIVVELYDAEDNTDFIESDIVGGIGINVQLTGRTLYKDGSWNTICLPFDVTVADSPLAGATVYELDTENSSLTTTTLTLNFNEVTTIEAGMPYLIKWTSGDNITDPIFYDVTSPEEDWEAQDVTACDGAITFTGTYDPVPFDAGDESILYVGANNKLYYPSAEVTMNAFRAYFKIDESKVQTKHIALKFGDDDATGISTVEAGDGSETIYNVAGQRLNKAQKGVNIVNGKKILK